MKANMKDVDGGHIAIDLYPFIREYKDGHVERFLHSPFVAASDDAAASHGVATRDVIIDEATGVSARLFLPSLAVAAGRKLPVIMYVHGGSFCTESAFGRTYHNYARSLATRARAVVVSVEYRLAPEHPVPTAYEDAWVALQWVASLSDPWLSAYTDPGRMFLVGDSAGGNIVYNTAVRASAGSLIDIEGLVMVQPYFWGLDRLSSSEAVWNGVAMFPPYGIDRLWPFVTAGRLGGDDPRLNPVEKDIASLTCRRVLVAVADKDSLRERGRWLAARMRDCCPWAVDDDAVTLVESEGEDHGFHLYYPLRKTSKILMESIVQLINKPTALPLPAAFLPDLDELHGCQDGETSPNQRIFGVPTTPYVDIFGYGAAMKDCSGPKSTTPGCCLKIGQGKASSKAARYGSFLRPTSGSRHSLSANNQASFRLRSFV